MSMSTPFPSGVLLGDYFNGERGYRFDPSDSSHQGVKFAGEKELLDARPTGVATEPRIGWLFRKIFIALYSAESRLLLNIDGLSFDLTSLDIQLSRDTVFPCVKRFRVIQHGKTILSLKYVYTDLNEDGGFNVRDFFLMAHEVAQNRESRLRFTCGWDKVRAGMHPTDPKFQSTVQQKIDAVLRGQVE
jgi:hypothetical protein